MEERLYARAIRKAYRESVACCKDLSNKKRSKYFVKLIGEGLEKLRKRKEFGWPKSTTHVAWRDNGVPLFDITEFLFDVGLYELDDKKRYVKRALLLLESEFSRRTEEILKDFSKLTVGNAPMKIFIGSLDPKCSYSHCTEFPDEIAQAARHCTSGITGAQTCSLLFCTIPHCDAWKPAEDGNKEPDSGILNEFRAFSWSNGDWKKIDVDAVPIQRKSDSGLKTDHCQLIPLP